MRIGVIFHRDPFTRPPGIDLVRLRALAGGLNRLGLAAEIVAPVGRAGVWQDGLKVLPLQVMDEPGRYDLVKTCYHQSIYNIGRHEGPVVSRIVRVVDERLPERDEQFRAELLDCQDRIAMRAAAVAFNNTLNRDRWIQRYGRRQETVLTPTGCPSVIPGPGPNPYPPGEKVVLFLGSVAAPHMADLLNQAARRLAGLARIHLVGLNKTSLYGRPQELDPRIAIHRERPEEEVWDFIHWADLGLALATGPLSFDNDVSKVYNYLRGGLPVVCEDPILQTELVRETGLGEVFPFGDLDGLVQAAGRLLQSPPINLKEAAMTFMADRHSWERRVQTYARLFHRLTRQA